MEDGKCVSTFHFTFAVLHFTFLTLLRANTLYQILPASLR
jgi:hypothetical protein